MKTVLGGPQLGKPLKLEANALKDPASINNILKLNNYGRTLQSMKSNCQFSVYINTVLGGCFEN